ncbi:MAG: tRNA epoxyqueuosine(34) reductase QueG [Granulicatella sp.]|nr:tRNA epoxyqueuosine(34) reductase QueG [Granulicatella sp.]
MDIALLKEKIQKKSKELGIDKIGFASAAPFDHLAQGMQESKELGHTTGFEHPILEERIYPEKIFDSPKTIISIALAYPTLPSKKPERVKGERRGAFARASWGEDYHFILSRRMEALIEYIKSEVNQEDVAFKPMVDTGELIDVRVAERAGIGFVGKNGLLVTKEFGSYVYLGELITNIEFPVDSPVDYGCGDCTRCVDFCPTNALLGNGKMNAQRCLSYQTQTKGFMPKEYRKKIGHVIYGCDICQQVCPYNKGKDFHLHPEMEPSVEETHPLLKPLVTISNKEFKERFGKMAGSWRGKKPLQRNSIIALANYRDKTAVPLLLKVMKEDMRPVIKGTAAWAVSEIISESSEELIHYFTEMLEKAQKVEATTKEEADLVVELEEAIQTLREKLPKNPEEGSYDD